MAYGQVNSPKFYVNVLEWLNHAGLIDLDPVFLTIPDGITPEIMGERAVENLGRIVPGTIDGSYFYNPSSIILLGHNLNYADESITIKYDGIEQSLIPKANAIANGKAYRDNFSIWNIESFPTDTITIMGQTATKVKQIIFADAYSLPIACDLKMNMSIRMDGVRSMKTGGGSELINYKYLRPLKWGGKYNPFEYQQHSNEPVDMNRARVGRREWSISWAELHDSSVLPEYFSINWEGLIDSDGNHETLGATGLLDQGDNFFSKVLNRTQGGRLPFLLQIDGDNYNADQFALTRIKKNNIKVTQINNKTVRINLKLEECW